MLLDKVRDIDTLFDVGAANENIALERKKTFRKIGKLEEIEIFVAKIED